MIIKIIIHFCLLSAPSKPKFLENLISRVSKKVSQDTNGLINALPLDTDDPETDEPLSPDSEQCLEVAESLADELIACTQRPASGESCDSGQGSSLLESTCDFSPTSKLKSWSTPTSPTFQGIVKQRLQNFQAIRETSLPPGELGKSPARKTQSLCTEKRKLQDTQLSARRFHCSLKKGDEKFTQSVMESGYVKALVSRLNRSTSFEDNEYDDSIDSRRESDDVVNGVKVNLKDENLDDWPDEFDGGDEIDDENTGKSPRRKSHSVKDQLKKFETCSSKSNSSISSSSSWRKKSDQSIGANDSSITNVRRRSHSPKKDLDKQQNRIAEYSGAVSSNESLTDSGSSTAKTFSELQTQVSKALKRFNHERNKHISSRLTSSSASSYSSFQNSNCVRSPPILRRPKSSDDAKPNANNSVKGAGARTLEKSRSVELDRTSDTASSSPVSSSFDYGLMPLSPAELFDQHWSKSEFSFDDFSDDEGTNISKLKVI